MMNELPPAFEKDEHDTIYVKQPLPDGRRMLVEPMTYGRARLCICNKAIPGILDEVFEYPSADALLIWLVLWNPEKEREPQGWHRHPGSRRYRIGGMAEMEYVKDDEGPIESRIAWAIAVIRGKDRQIESIEEMTERLGTSFPESAQCFFVSSTSSECLHTPKCKWLDSVYMYLDRLVVVSSGEAEQVPVGNVIERLAGRV